MNNLLQVKITAALILLFLTFPAHADLPDFSTLPALLLYKVNYGGQDADIVTSLPYHPYLSPKVTIIDNEELVFKWLFRRQAALSSAESGLPPKWLKIHLFQPRDPNLPTPAPPVSEDPNAFTLRGENKQMEDSELWKNYINPNYVRVDGVDVVAHSREDLNNDRANINWPNKRRSHTSYFVGERACLDPTIVDRADCQHPYILLEDIPLRVSAVVGETQSTFLVVTEIKRTLRLNLRPFKFEVLHIAPESRLVPLARLLSGELSLGEMEKVYGYRFESIKKDNIPIKGNESER